MASSTKLPTPKRKLPAKIMPLCKSDGISTVYRHEDEKWMSAAIQLAEKGRYAVSPNPMVGACIVRSGQLISEGYHQQFGGDHAEIMALKKAGTKARGSTIYVTLEPCASWGKTPPCVNAIVQAGIRRVVIGMMDPNPKNYGKGIRALRNEGLAVRHHVLPELVRKQNAAFFKYVKTGLPFVTLKMAQSIDGKIAARSGQSRWISSREARLFVHHLRAEQDAVMVGKNTLLLDDPMLSPRCRVRNRRPEKPWRVVLDPHLQIRPRAKIFTGPQQTLLAVLQDDLKAILKRLPDKCTHAVLLPVPARKGLFDLPFLLKKLASLGVAKLLVEGGGELAWSLLSQGLVDRAYWIIAPKIIGGRTSKTSAEGEGIVDLAYAIHAPFNRVERLGKDLLISAELD
jgi:diaminohydroxyphosphoribosylaminopyrimidine deaminase/5-amino-6-(5-phosphoribosylamino)uracil reductase